VSPRSQSTAHHEGYASAAGSSFQPSTVWGGGFVGDGQIWQWRLQEAWIWLGGTGVGMRSDTGRLGARRINAPWRRSVGKDEER